MTRLLRILTVTGVASCLSWAMLGNTLYAQSATPAPSPTPSAPTATLEQRVAGSAGAGIDSTVRGAEPETRAAAAAEEAAGSPRKTA